MLIVNKKPFFGGMVLMISFLIVLYILFLPMFNGKNAIHEIDNLFNSLAKGSSYYFDNLEKKVTFIKEQEYDFDIEIQEDLVKDSVKIINFYTNKIYLRNNDNIVFTINLNTFLSDIVKEGKMFYLDKVNFIQQKYNLPAKKVFFIYWKLLKEMQKQLKLEKKVKEAKILSSIIKRCVELSYNFFGIVPEKVSEKAWILSAALAFYVIYTLWFGFAIFFLFEGFGFAMTKGSKAEH
ncbi:hypothetical protein [Desulfonauticus submarinus]